MQFSLVNKLTDQASFILIFYGSATNFYKIGFHGSYKYMSVTDSCFKPIWEVVDSKKSKANLLTIYLYLSLVKVELAPHSTF